MPKKRNVPKKRKRGGGRPTRRSATQHWSIPPKDPVRGGTPEAGALFSDVLMDNKMSCRATYLSDPLLGMSALVKSQEEDIPVLLFEPAKILAVKDTRTGTIHEMRTERLVVGGFQRLTGGLWNLEIVEGWGIYRTSTSVLLRDPEGDVAAEGNLVLDSEWVSAVVSVGFAIVLQGAPLGVRIPPGRKESDYSDQERVLEFRQARRNGILAGGIVKWGGNNRDALKWVLFPAGVFGIPLPVAYMPLWNLELHGGPEVFGFERLNVGSIGAQAVGMVANIAEADLDLERPTETDPQISFIAGYRDGSAGSPDSPFLPWRESAIRCGGIVAIAGPREMPTIVGSGSGNNALAWEILHDSWGAVVPLGGDCLTQSVEMRERRKAEGGLPLTETIELSREQAEYAEILRKKLDSIESFKVNCSYDLEELIDRESLFRWVTNMWPVACQTCGDPLGSTVDISVDGPFADGKVLLSMHHSSCRTSGVTPSGGVSMKCPTSSYAVGNLGNHAGKPGRGDVPVMIVNPACEQLQLQQIDSSTWINATLEPFKELGFISGGKTPPRKVKEAVAYISQKYLIVRVSHRFTDLPEQEWVIEAPEHVIEQVRRLEGLVVSLLTKALPTRLSHGDIPSACGDPEALIGWVPLKVDDSL
ncbi:hypothetical protein OG601_18010 [Streptomyces sp. NBC_01239]|uniref:hypothetical protein n=1 Tax=Streptomyces sp. NBC_01239 TaxID=2903792 RepID=UPI00225C3C9E|nr:hypothetical protein [Streptomyces sp. NBC_01239]MCX4812502.1 hypothetical protein [Streptomyces sp. NBC_01239]